MSKYKYEGYGVVRDTEIDFPYHTDDIVELLDEKDQQIADLETKLEESEKQIKDAREAGNMAVDSWCKNRRKYEAQIAEMQNKSFILYSMLYETLEKQGCENVASQIDQMTGWTYDKEADWLKGNRNYDQLKQQLAEKEKEIENLNNRILISQLQAPEEQRLKIIGSSCCQYNPKQDKISFCIEQLEQIINLFEPYENEEKDTILCANNGISFLEYIENQINELKEMK